MLLKMSLIVLLKMGKGWEKSQCQKTSNKKCKNLRSIQTIFKINNLGPSLFIGLINMVLC